jgi:hypothetical protein
VLERRLAVASDALLLREFQCATSDETWDLEVQFYVSERALGDSIAFSQTLREFRLLLWFDAGELVAVGAHQAITQLSEDGTYLVVLAISVERQGSRLETGERLADVVLTELMQDGLATHPGQIIFGVVHAANERSRAVCKRNFFSELPHLPPDHDYRYVARRT